MMAAAVDDLFAVPSRAAPWTERLAAGAVILHGFATDEAASLLDALRDIQRHAPFRHMITPGGYRMAVAMTSCGSAGWVTDRRGYRYELHDPETGRAWPPMPDCLRTIARRAAAAAGFPGFVPDACLINRYEPGNALSLHQDKNERDLAAPVVSVSLGLPAVFLFGGARRAERPGRYRLEHGDVAVWGGPARLTYHGVKALADGTHRLTGQRRFNLTFRKAL